MEQCSQIELIGAYHDGELSPARRAEVEAHLRRCSACGAELEELRRLSALISTKPGCSISPEFFRSLHERVDEWTDSSTLRFAQLLSGIAAVLLIGVGGWLLATPVAAVEVVPHWEHAAVTLHPESPVSSGSIRTAEWIATDLRTQR